MMKVTAIAVISVVAMATSEGFILHPFARYRPFPFGMMRAFPGMIPYPPLTATGGATPFGPGSVTQRAVSPNKISAAPHVPSAAPAPAPAPVPAAPAAAMIDVVAPAAQGPAAAYDTVVDPYTMGTHPVY